MNIDQPPSDWRSAQLPGGLLTFELLRDWHARLLTDRNAFMREVIPMMFSRPLAENDLLWMHPTHRLGAADIESSPPTVLPLLGILLWRLGETLSAEFLGASAGLREVLEL